MPVMHDRVDANTRLGAELVDGGATFRVWAPRARQVYVNGTFGGIDAWQKDADASWKLAPQDGGFWAGFVPDAADGDRYKFYVVGEGSSGYGRDPYARELTTPGNFPGTAEYPKCDCVIRNPETFPWHDHGFTPPPFHELVIYQLHVGTFAGPERDQGTANFLDVLERLDHFRNLNINALQLLPVNECQTDATKGYNGTDFFSPEMLNGADLPQLDPYVDKLNALLEDAKKGPPYKPEQLVGSVAQLKALIDILHINGIAVFFDVVFNHGSPADDEAMSFIDRPASLDPDNSLYFTSKDITGGRAFKFKEREVRRFLINNAKFWFEEYHIDGYRYDEVSHIVNSDGTSFAKELTGKIRQSEPGNIQIAEYWNDDRERSVRSTDQDGLGFDAAWEDTLRERIRGVIKQVRIPGAIWADMEGLVKALSHRPHGFPAFWRAVQYIESHDEVKRDSASKRIPVEADETDARSWPARSRSRVALGLLMSSPCVPMIFMGQEFLERKNWDDNPSEYPGRLIDWDGIKPEEQGGNSHMRDFLDFTREILRIRGKHPALRSEKVQPLYWHNNDKILAFQRWVEWEGRDVVVIASFNEQTHGWPGYRLPFPKPGKWLEVFNSDAFDDMGRHHAIGNAGSVWADNTPLWSMPASASVIIPANGLLIFAHDSGD